MISIYLAGRYGRRKELLEKSYVLGGFANVRITSTWLLEDDRHLADSVISQRDVRDILICNWLLNFTDGPVDLRAKDVEWRMFRGGRHVEFGIGLALNKRLILIGPRENVFHHQIGTEHFFTFEDFLHRHWKELNKNES